jgi:hypothetical protein
MVALITKLFTKYTGSKSKMTTKSDIEKPYFRVTFSALSGGNS